MRKVWFNKTYSSNTPNDNSPVRDFYRTVNDMQDDMYEGVTPCKEMDLSESEQEELEKAKNCYVCAEKFSLDKNNLRNRDHCHKSGLVFYIMRKYFHIHFSRYLGAACTIYNLKMSIHPELNIYVHNLRGSINQPSQCYTSYF